MDCAGLSSFRLSDSDGEKQRQAGQRGPRRSGVLHSRTHDTMGCISVAARSGAEKSFRDVRSTVAIRVP